MAVFRFLAAVFLLIATIAIVADATPAIYGAGPFRLTSLSAHWQELGRSSFEAAESGMTAVAPWLWNGLIAPILAIPTCVTFFLLAVASGYAGRRRRTVRVFVN